MTLTIGRPKHFIPQVGLAPKFCITFIVTDSYKVATSHEHPLTTATFYNDRHCGLHIYGFPKPAGIRTYERTSHIVNDRIRTCCTGILYIS